MRCKLRRLDRFLQADEWDQPLLPEKSTALDDSHRRLQAVLNNASVAIFLMDDRQRCVYMNKAAEDLTGWTLPEVLVSDRPLHDIIHHSYPDGRPFPLHECAIDRAFPEHNQVQGEEIFIHKGGSFFPVAFTASPIRDEASQTIGTIIEVRDISDERRARDRQQLLINELNHRVKNTLATVQSVAWQTFRDVDNEALGRFNGRLATLSKAHNILSQEAWHKASFLEVVRVALEPFDAEQIDVEGPDCDIHPKACVTLSMVLYELATNAVKYGALKTPEGRVSLHWTCVPRCEATAFGMLWEERGGPPVAVPTRRGFGTRLIERQLAGEFGGSAQLDFRVDGLRCTIDLHMPRKPDPLNNASCQDDSA